MGRDAPREGWGWFAAVRTVVISNNRRDAINIPQPEFWLQPEAPLTPPSLGKLPPNPLSRGLVFTLSNTFFFLTSRSPSTAAAPSLPLPAPSLTPAEGFHSPPPSPLRSTRSSGPGSSCPPAGKPALDHPPLHSLQASLVGAAQPNTYVCGGFT